MKRASVTSQAPVCLTDLDRMIGARARILRLKKKLSLDEAAARSGQPCAEMVAMEEGRARLGAITMFSLCAEYGVSPHCFYSGIVDETGRRADARLFVQLLKNAYPDKAANQA